MQSYYLAKGKNEIDRMKIMKCILIDPPRKAVNIVQDEVILKATEKASRFPPIGLAYLAGYLQSNGIEAQIIDAKSLNMPYPDICKIVVKEESDIVGVTVFTSNLKSSLTTCREIKKAYPPAKIVVGGAHIHPQHREVIEKPYIDFCVRGEGEETLLELTEALSNGKDLEQVKGLTFKKDHNVIVTADRPFIKDLDSLPFPARNLLQNKIYQGQIGNGWGTFTAVSASRGCPFKCHYCSVPQFWPLHRKRSVQNVLRELQEIRYKYGIKNVRFTDELITLNKKWLIEFCRGMVDRGLNKEIAWSCDSRVDTISKTLLEEMEKANCKVIFYGIEFGNQRILDFCNKGIKISQIHQAIELTKEVGITPTGNFMIGYPTETIETIEDTISLIKSLKLDFGSVSIVTPFPGSQLYNYCQKNNLLRTDNWEEYSYFHPLKPVIKLDGLAGEDLNNLYQKAYFELVYKDISEELKREIADM